MISKFNKTSCLILLGDELVLILIIISVMIIICILLISMNIIPSSVNSEDIIIV